MGGIENMTNNEGMTLIEVIISIICIIIAGVTMFKAGQERDED